MRSVLACLVGLGVLGSVAAAFAGTTDISTLSSKVTAYNGASPSAGAPTLVKVMYTNNGPSAYTGTGGGNALSVTVDIDEPSKPGMPGTQTSFLSFTRSFAFNISAAHTDSIVADFGYVPGHAGPGHSRVTCTAQGVNVDPNSSNNQEPSSQLFLIRGSVPAAGNTALAMLAASLCGFAYLGIRRRRARNAA